MQGLGGYGGSAARVIVQAGIVPHMLIGIDRATSVNPDYNPAMSELALARLVQEAEVKQRPEVVREHALSLLLALSPEVARIAVLMAMCASAANTLATGRDPKASRALTLFYPRLSSRFILALMRYRRLEPDGAVSDNLCTFHEALSNCLTASVHYALRGKRPAREDAGPLQDLVDVWRKACAAAHGLLSSIEQAMQTFNLVESSGRQGLLLLALANAASGGAPMRNEAGEFVLPEWAEQRNSPRLKVDCSGKMMVGSNFYDIKLNDIATGGAGIETGEQLSIGDRIVIVVNDHVVLPGCVVWIKPPRIGVAFDRALVDDSPAYMFLADLPQPR